MRNIDKTHLKQRIFFSSPLLMCAYDSGKHTPANILCTFCAKIIMIPGQIKLVVGIIVVAKRNVLFTPQKVRG
jgi:hypothetical protein